MAQVDLGQVYYRPWHAREVGTHPNYEVHSENFSTHLDFTLCRPGLSSKLPLRGENCVRNRFRMFLAGLRHVFGFRMRPESIPENHVAGLKVD